MEFDVANVDKAKEKWAMAIEPARLAFRRTDLEAAAGDDAPPPPAPPPDTEPIIVERHELSKRVQIVDAWIFRSLSIQRPGTKKKVSFRLSREAFEAFRRWAEPWTTAEFAAALRRRSGHAFFFGASCLIIASRPGVRGEGIPPFAGLPSVPMEPILAALGVALLLVALGIRLITQRFWFVVDTALYVAAASVLAYHLWYHDAGWWNWLVLLLLVPLAIGGWRQYPMYANVAPETIGPLNETH